MGTIPALGRLAAAPWYPGKGYHGAIGTARRELRERGPWWPPPPRRPRPVTRPTGPAA